MPRVGGRPAPPGHHAAAQRRGHRRRGGRARHKRDPGPQRRTGPDRLGPTAARRSTSPACAARCCTTAPCNCSPTGTPNLPDLCGTVSTPAVIATLAAWRDSQPWQDQMLGVLDRNRRRVHEVLTGTACGSTPPTRGNLPELGRHLRARVDGPVERIRRAGVLVDGGVAFASRAASSSASTSPPPRRSSNPSSPAS
jgi:cysteine-S-conjugate beta-lyase